METADSKGGGVLKLDIQQGLVIDGKSKTDNCDVTNLNKEYVE